MNALVGLTPDVQQMVLDEAASRIVGSKIRSHSGYLFSMIGKAKAGTFKLWAASQGQTDKTVSSGDSSIPNATHSPKQGSPPYRNGAGQPAATVFEPRGPRPVSEVARKCMDEIRAIARGAG